MITLPSDLTLKAVAVELQAAEAEFERVKRVAIVRLLRRSGFTDPENEYDAEWLKTIIAEGFESQDAVIHKLFEGIQEKFQEEARQRQ